MTASERATMTRMFSEPEAQGALMALAERAGEAGARRAVKDSFFLLGVDLEDQASVDDFRAGMRRMRIDEKQSNERHNQVRGSAIGGMFSLAVAILAAIATTLITTALKAGSVVSSAVSVAPPTH